VIYIPGAIGFAALLKSITTFQGLNVAATAVDTDVSDPITLTNLVAGDLVIFDFPLACTKGGTGGDVLITMVKTSGVASVGNGSGLGNWLDRTFAVPAAGVLQKHFCFVGRVSGNGGWGGVIRAASAGSDSTFAVAGIKGAVYVIRGS
jgi:hypothetical protein